jgi:hypothetical protein
MSACRPAAIAVVMCISCVLSLPFSVPFNTPDSLGLQLSVDLFVTGFHRHSSDEKMPAEASGWIKEGDELFAVNGEIVKGRLLSDVQSTVAKAQLPKILTFKAVGG